MRWAKTSKCKLVQTAFGDCFSHIRCKSCRTCRSFVHYLYSYTNDYDAMVFSTVWVFYKSYIVELAKLFDFVKTYSFYNSESLQLKICHLIPAWCSTIPFCTNCTDQGMCSGCEEGYVLVNNSCGRKHYSDVMMGAMVYQIPSLTIV